MLYINLFGINEAMGKIYLMYVFDSVIASFQSLTL